MEKIELFDNIVFGRDEGSDILVDDVEVSGSHFKIQIIDYEVYIIDLGSSNKTFLNDIALIPGEKFKLNAKDIVRIGSEEFSYSSSAVKKLNLPEMSKSLELARFDQESDPTLRIERIENEEVYEEGDSLPKVEILRPREKAETGLKALRNSKKYIEELEEVNKDICEKIEGLKKMRRRKIEVGAKMDQMKKILANSEYKTAKDFENELRIHRGTVEGFKLKIKREEKEIERAKEAIQKAEQEIAQAKFNISSLNGESQVSKDSFDSVKNEYEIFQNKSVFENEFETLKETIKKYESLDLETKLVEVGKEIKLKTAQLKDMQNQYGAKLNSEIKKKAASE
ncbi:MAG: pSer/pThr/pTyr-binding forkhead associated (FHA) protein [Bacteriovoracaceae bacterium]|jgi:pSer/pThr/pTyr-binding forkhead associated (FHA) protein